MHSFESTTGAKKLFLSSYVISTSPCNKATDVPLIAPTILIKFDKGLSIDPSKASTALALSEILSGQTSDADPLASASLQLETVAGLVYYDTSKHLIIFIPTAPLRPSTSYIVTADTQSCAFKIPDRGAGNIITEFKFSFTTKPVSTIRLITRVHGYDSSRILSFSMEPGNLSITFAARASALSSPVVPFHELDYIALQTGAIETRLFTDADFMNLKDNDMIVIHQKGK